MSLQAGAAEHDLVEALDFDRFAEIARLASLCANYWHSIALAADRGDALTTNVHCHQAASVTREAFALVKTLGSPEASL